MNFDVIFPKDIIGRMVIADTVQTCRLSIPATLLKESQFTDGLFAQDDNPPPLLLQTKCQELNGSASSI